MNVASYYDYVLINSYLAFCFLLFDRTTLLQLVVNSLFSYGWPKKQQEVLPLPLDVMLVHHRVSLAFCYVYIS